MSKQEEIHGQISQNPHWSGARWCEVCQHYHGILYPCLHYPPNILKEIDKDSRQFMENITDPEWIQKQLDGGTPPEVIAILQFFGGIND